MLLALVGTVPAASAQEVLPLITEAQYEGWLENLSNWGRWGPDDEIGALNLITPAKRRAAAALVQEGITVSLARTAQSPRALARPRPAAPSSGGTPCSTPNSSTDCAC